MGFGGFIYFYGVRDGQIIIKGFIASIKKKG